MSTPEPRYLRFDYIDVASRQISGECSRCGQHFLAASRNRERLEAVAVRVQKEFDLHKCTTESKPMAQTIMKPKP